MSSIRYNLNITSTNKVSVEVKVDVDNTTDDLKELDRIAYEQFQESVDNALLIKGQTTRKL